MSFLHHLVFFSHDTSSTRNIHQMTQMTEVNNSMNSLPSYHANADIIPTYSALVQELPEPQRVYIAQQRDLLESAKTKPLSKNLPTTQSVDIESQHECATVTTNARGIEQAREPSATCAKTKE